MNTNKLYWLLPNLLQNALITAKGISNNHTRFNKYFSSYLSKLDGFQYQSIETIQEYQLMQLKQLVLEALNYTQRLKSVLDKNNKIHEQIKNAQNVEAVLHLFPFMLKDELRNAIEKATNLNPSRRTVYISKTSGTTGTPLKIEYDAESIGASFAMWKRFHHWIGINGKMKSVRFSGQLVVHPEKRRPPFWAYDFWNKQLIMSSYHLTDENIKHYIDKLNRFKPQFLDGYPSTFVVLAKYILTHQIKLDYKPIAIATTAETLSILDKEIISTAFQCSVYNQYASSDGAPFITECPNNRLHVNSDTGVFEYMNSDGNVAKPGELAELIVTSFRTFKVPLIRYRIGDWVKLPYEQRKCECGSSFPIVDEVSGREDDLLFSVEKGYVGRLDTAYKGLKGIVKSQIIQKSIDKSIVLNIVDENYNQAVEQLLISNLHERLGKGMKVEVIIVDNIPLANNGKFKSVKREFVIK